MTAEINRLVPVPQVPARQSDQRHCFSCGKVIHASAPTCPECGAMQRDGASAPTLRHEPGMAAQDAMFCYGCGTTIHRAAPACPRCGAPHRTVLSGRPPKDRTAAILLAFLLGGIGAHKFYLNQPGWGVLYILFCWTFIPAIIGVIEGLMYLSQNDEDFARAHSG